MPAPHVVSDANRHLVREASGKGLPKEDIASLLMIDQKTLNKYYEADIAIGRAVANLDVAGTGYAMAKSGREAAMTKFWLQSRLGFKVAEEQQQLGNMTVNLHINTGIIREEDANSTISAKSEETTVSDDVEDAVIVDDEPVEAKQLRLPGF